VSAYALTNDYAAEAAHFVRYPSRVVRAVSGRSFFGQRSEASSLARPLKYPWDHAALPVRGDNRDRWG
jgi:hypothetical protein